MALMTTPRTANPARSMLATWGLTREVTASMVEALAWALFSTGRTLVSTNLATFTVSLAATARESLHAVNQCTHVFAFSPDDRRARGCVQIKS